MSVINQMLRDLDRQQHAPGNLPGEVQPVPPAAGAWGRWAALAGLMLLAGSLGFALRAVFAPAPDAVRALAPAPSMGAGKGRGAAPAIPARPLAEPLAEPKPAQPELKAAPAQAAVARPAETAGPEPVPAKHEPLPAEPARAEAPVEAAAEPVAEAVESEPELAPAPQLRKTPAADAFASRFAQAVLYLQQGRAAEAEALLAPLLAERPESPETRLLLARARLGRAAEARALLAEREPPLAGHAGYHAVLAALEQQLGAHAAAAARYGALVRLDERQAAWWLGLGLALDGLGRRDEALPAYRRALDLNQLAGPAREHAAARVAGGK